MTDNKIEENAENWVSPMRKVPSCDSDTIALVKSAYIYGAHSRDEEIEDLENGGKDLINTMTRMQAELDHLRNPWISVEERLPDEPFSVGSNRSKEVYVRTAKGCNYIASYNFNRKDWIIVKDGYVELTNDNVIKWMPIPN